jgi:peptidoglycan glycosyltransferase
MSRQLRRVAWAMFALFGILFVNLNVIQVLRAEEFAQDNRNARQLIREYDIRRGSIVVEQSEEADETEEIARVVETAGRLRYLRRYPAGPLYAHVTGFYSIVYGRAQLESTYNDFLVGSAPETFARNIVDLLAGRERRGDDLIATIDPDVQAAAAEALGDRIGAVAAIDPSTGEVLALWSNPTYDPNVLSSHDTEAIRDYWERLEADPDKPRLNRATQAWYPPGSTFKVVTAAAALESGIGAQDTFPDPVRQPLPLTSATIGNFGGGPCNRGQPITLERALEVSCNTTFAQLGLRLGSEALVEQAEAFGLNQAWPFDLPLLESRIPDELDPPATAQSAIGQRDVRVTPLQMAMVAGAVANEGELLRPRVVRRVEDFAGRIIQTYEPEPLVFPGKADAQVMSPENARTLRELMVGVVEAGTGRRARIPGVRVGGKTGTAQHGDGPPFAWFIGFAPADAPRVAVAVVIEGGGGLGDEATGGVLAAPVARAVMEAALRD